MTLLSACLLRAIAATPLAALGPYLAKPTPAPLSRPAMPPTTTIDPVDDERPGCGWFESSLALREGLAVTEWPAAAGAPGSTHWH